VISSREQTFNASSGNLRRSTTAIIAYHFVCYRYYVSIDALIVKANPILRYRDDHQPRCLFKPHVISSAFPQGFSSSRVKEARHRARLLIAEGCLFWLEFVEIVIDGHEDRIVCNVEFSSFFFLNGHAIDR